MSNQILTKKINIKQAEFKILFSVFKINKKTLFDQFI